MVLVLGAMALGPQLAYGQGATTGNLVGSATSKDDGSTLPGAVVVAVHEPTGTRYQSVTRADGSFSIRNVRVGGPYKVSVTMHGFEPAE
jgi:hypothetical protein